MKKILFTYLLILMCFNPTTFAAQNNGDDTSLNSENCVASKWFDSNGNPISIEEKFGRGSTAVTRCLRHTKRVKALYQINQQCKNSACSAPYAIDNIVNDIEDLTSTHGMEVGDYEIIAIVHGDAWKLVLDNNAAVPHSASNPFQAAMMDLLAKPGIKVLFSQKTAAEKSVVLANMLSGVGFVPSAGTAIADL